MRSSFITQGLFLATSLITSSNALLALTDSPCAIQCGNVLGSTSGSDITCLDANYGAVGGGYATSAATTFQSCLNCQLSSTYVDAVTNQTDLQMALYNLRYTVSYCLFGYPDNTNVGTSPCTTSFACSPLESGFEFDSLATNASEYGYCADFPALSEPKCQGCLVQEQTEFFLSNFFTALEGACEQQPVDGATVSLQGSLFSKTAMNITTPSASSVSTYNAQTGLSIGSKFAIALAGVLVLLAVAGFCIICFGRRRRRRAIAQHQQKTGYTAWLAEQQMQQSTPPQMMGAFNGGSGFHDSPVSQRPLMRSGSNGWGEPNSAVSNQTETPISATDNKTYFSPYSSQYSSPISALDQTHIQGREWPAMRKGSSSGLHGLEERLERSKSTEKRFFPDDDEYGDRIELQNVAPVLLHPGHGRNSPPGRQTPPGLSVEDVKRGDAI